MLVSTENQTVPLSSTCHVILQRLVAIPKTTICPKAGKGGEADAHPPMCLFMSPDGQMLERFGASVHRMHCMALIQQSSCSKALHPQRCFSAIKEHSSPSRPPSSTDVLAPFPPFSDASFLPSSVIQTANRWDGETCTDVQIPSDLLHGGLRVSLN